MKIFNFETVNSIPALSHTDKNLLVISDLHLGLEKTMTFKGNYIPQNQLKQMKEDISEAKDITGADRILVNGDLKNQFKTSYSENEEVKELANFLNFNFDEVIIVEGNHDTFLKSNLSERGIEMKDYHIEGRILFAHGDKSLEELEIENLENIDTIVIGHEHPAIAMKDDIGVKEKVPALLYGETGDGKNLVVLPAFSKIANGTSVNEVPEKELLSPVLKNNASKEEMKAVGISREAGLLEFPKLSKL
ncbi:MAG: putative SbcD/Mre11-related phosphoesterase [Candidatus Nanohaloarchaea archaeon]|jgi:putative SbcD/Mre11-related phosphoesterase